MRGNRVNLKNVPLGAWIFASVAVVTIVAAYVIMPLTGADPAQLRSLINQVLNIGTLVAAGGTAIYSGAAARNSEKTVEQTNGVLDAERTAIAQEAATQAVAEYIARKGQG
jgi:hypothetical protein